MPIDQSKVIAVTNDRYRLKYHLATPSGWMNDPNGFSYFKGYYHIFYQYYPYDSCWGPMHWGHARSKDLIHWETLPPALIPGDPEDEDGCFSGSAIVKDNQLVLIYTGHHYYDKSDPNHFWQNQNMAFSEDGIHFKKYDQNPIISAPPADNTEHFRDPKVWERDGIYYLVIGSQNTHELGRVLLYTSTDLLNWQLNGPITEAHSAEDEGFMWECPDIFRLNGRDILLFSPQGIKRKEKDYLNLYQTGYFVGALDYEHGTLEHKNFTELDRGHDFYATQTLLAPDGRRILFGWMDMWEADMPEKEDGWAGALTLPRELLLKDDRIYMLPIKEVQSLRIEKLCDETLNVSSHQLVLSDINHLELGLDMSFQDWDGSVFKLSLHDQKGNELSLTIDAQTQALTLFRTGRDPYRYGKTEQNNQATLQVFIDTSSVEIFINEGEIVFSERFYHEDNLAVYLEADKDIPVNVHAYRLN
ncbi:MAG: sucrose-6-phosphate hydrolase [Sporolactobacillus sp.]